MCKESKRTFNTISDFLRNRPEFTFQELCDEIRNNKGIMLLSPYLDVRDYLKELESCGKLEYKKGSRKYIVHRCA